MIWVLIGAAVVSGFLREWVDALAIIAIVILNAILGFVQEYRAEKSLAALKKLSSPTSKVIRDGDYRVVPSSEIVPGDLVELEAGDNVPADSRVVWHTSNFSVQEASLTGESTPVLKTAAALDERDVPLADRANMVYMGTSVASGKARALVTGTGMKTELGKIAGMIQEIEHETTPLQKKLEQFGKWIVYLCFVLVGLVFLLEWLRGGKVIDMFLTAVSLAVAAIPEGLPGRRHHRPGPGRPADGQAPRPDPEAAVRGDAGLRHGHLLGQDRDPDPERDDGPGRLRRRPAVQGDRDRLRARGRVPRRRTRPVDPSGLPGPAAGRSSAASCATAPSSSGRTTAPTGSSATRPRGPSSRPPAKAGISGRRSRRRAIPLVEEIPFDSERKKMTIIRQDGGRFAAFVKGAPDILLGDCTDDRRGRRDRGP